MRNWRQILSWQTLDDPRNLMGWLIRDTSETQPDYTVVTKVEIGYDGDVKLWGAWSSQESTAIALYNAGSHTVDPPYIRYALFYDDRWKKFITPIRKIDDINKVSWQSIERVEDLTGWLVKDVVHSDYGVIKLALHDARRGKCIIRARWADTEEEAIESDSYLGLSHFSIDEDTWKTRFIPIRKIS